MNWLDANIERAVAIVSPRRAAKMQHVRLMRENRDYRDTFLAAMRAFGYRSANTSATDTPWIGSGGSADQEILNDLPALRNRSRELSRVDSIGSGLLRTFVCNIVGTGMVPQANTMDNARNNLLESVWAERKDSLFPADRMTHAQSQRQIVQRRLEDGDVLVKQSFVKDAPVFFEVVESERLATPIGEQSNERIVSGVERNGLGHPAFYHINKHHPGDMRKLGSMAQGDFIRVPAFAVRHFKDAERPGQTRGVPMLHAILQDIRDLDLLMVASLKRVQIAACLSVFIQTEDSDLGDVFDATAEKYGYTLDQKLEPGMIFKLYPRETVSTLIPNFPTPEFEPFTVMIARRIGAALGVSWQTVLRDFSQSTYSSARTDLLETWGTYDIYTRDFIDTILNWEWHTVMVDAQLRGDARLRGMADADLRAVRWIPKGRKWVDPKKEAEAALIELQMGTTNLRDICAAKGTDWEEILMQRIIEEKAEMDMRAAAGLPEREPRATASALVEQLIAEVRSNNEED